MKAEANMAQKGAREMAAAWEALQRAFVYVTRVGDSRLTLGIGSVNTEDDGNKDANTATAFYLVRNASQLTAAGEKVKDGLVPAFDVMCNI